MRNNFDLKKFLIENKLTPQSQKLNENQDIKIQFLKQNEWDQLNDKYERNGKLSPEEEFLADAGTWDMEGYFDNTYPSLESFAEFIVKTDGGNVQNWLQRLNKTKDMGIISINKDPKGSLPENEMWFNSGMNRERESGEKIEKGVNNTKEENFLTSRLGRMLASELKQMISQPFGTEEFLDIVQDLKPTPQQLIAAAESIGLNIMSDPESDIDFDIDNRNWQDDGAILTYFPRTPEVWSF